MSFDAIVVGSGMSGGWVAKELSERGLKTLVLERGNNLEHGTDYTDTLSPWELDNYGLVSENEIDADYPIQSQCYAFSSATKHLWVKDSDHPYTTPADKPFMWIRGYHLGGRSIMWGRQSYRMSEMDFEANKKDGHGVDWPIRYADLAPWYDRVETFAGISGGAENMPQLPDGKFLPAMALTPPEAEFGRKMQAAFPGRRLIAGRCAHLTAPTKEHEELGRNACQYRSLCERGCSFGAYFSSLSATLPAAKRTGNMTVVTDAIVHSVVYDPKSGKATGVRVIDAKTGKGQTYEARVIFLNASTLGTAALMLNSRSEAFPTGIANRSDQVGRNLTDHLSALGASGVYPGFEDVYHHGRRPNGFYIPRYKNVTEPTDAFVRGYGFQGRVLRDGWQRGDEVPGVGVALKQTLRKPGPWRISLSGFGEMLQRPENRITLNEGKTDKWGIPVPHIEVGLGPNEHAMIDQVNADAKEMLERAGCTDIAVHKHYGGLGLGIHEMGTARMGRDPHTSVLNGFNQTHDVANLFVTDGSAMASSGCQNPSLTYMALSARAAHHAADLMRDHLI